MHHDALEHERALRAVLRMWSKHRMVNDVLKEHLDSGRVHAVTYDLKTPSTPLKQPLKPGFSLVVGLHFYAQQRL